MSAHSPLPWTATEIRDPADGRYIADVHRHDGPETNDALDVANKNVAIAAPKMLEVLKRLMAHVALVNFPEAALEQDADFARAVIAEAEGR